MRDDGVRWDVVSSGEVVVGWWGGGVVGWWGGGVVGWWGGGVVGWWWWVGGSGQFGCHPPHTTSCCAWPYQNLMGNAIIDIYTWYVQSMKRADAVWLIPTSPPLAAPLLPLQ